MRRRTWTVRLAAAAGVMTLSGCGLSPVGGQPTPAPAPLPADQLVFSVRTGGGFVPATVAAMETPSLLVYGDGRVIQVADAGQNFGVPKAYEVTTIDPLLVARFAIETEALDLITDATDFGDPRVTDMPSTSVRLHGAGQPHAVSVYAFTDQFEDDLDADERKARRQLSEVIDRAQSLAGDAESKTYQPETVKVQELDRSAADTKAAAWPGPDPDGFLTKDDRGYIGIACGLLSGPQANEVYLAAQDNAGATWTVDGQRRVLIVTPALPLDTTC